MEAVSEDEDGSLVNNGDENGQEKTTPDAVAAAVAAEEHMMEMTKMDPTKLCCKG